MKVIRARVLGFCMGVRRAIELAESVVQYDSPVYTLGPLVHNPKVLEGLKAHGVHPISEIPDDGNCHIIIRAHGVSPTIENALRDKGCHIVDATCPNVKASQLKAEELSLAGYCLFLAGEAEHAEIKGILGYSKAAAFCEVAGCADEARVAAANLYKSNNNAKTALMGQTTICEDTYTQIANEVRKFFPNLEVIHTICTATIERQQALRELLLETDAVIIVGGKESANTKRLFEIAKESGKPCVLLEEPGHIPVDFYNYNNVGICAGASTPDSMIDEIELELLR